MNKPKKQIKEDRSQYTLFDFGDFAKEEKLERHLKSNLSNNINIIELTYIQKQNYIHGR